MGTGAEWMQSGGCRLTKHQTKNSHFRALKGPMAQATLA